MYTQTVENRSFAGTEHLLRRLPKVAVLLRIVKMTLMRIYAQAVDNIVRWRMILPCSETMLVLTMIILLASMPLRVQLYLIRLTRVIILGFSLGRSSYGIETPFGGRAERVKKGPKAVRVLFL